MNDECTDLGYILGYTRDDERRVMKKQQQKDTNFSRTVLGNRSDNKIIDKISDEYFA